MEERAKAVVRLIVAVMIVVNAILVASGHSPIAYDEGIIYEVVSDIALGASVLWVWWKNNNITDEAAQAQEYLKDMKYGNGVIHYDDEVDADDVEEAKEADVHE